MYRVFIGYDSRETVSYHVLAHSIMRHASAPITVTPLKRDQLPYYRTRSAQESTEFSLTRFLVPYLCNYEGWALFMDCDMLVTQDIVPVFQMAHPKYAVLCTRHDYQTKHESKFLHEQNQAYPRKNWTSFMLMNAKACQYLTPDRVSKQSGPHLQRLEWLYDEQIGSIPLEWNFLVGEDYWMMNGHQPPANIHYTIGGPWFTDYVECDFADLWWAERDLMLNPQQ